MTISILSLQSSTSNVVSRFSFNKTNKSYRYLRCQDWLTPKLLLHEWMVYSTCSNAHKKDCAPRRCEKRRRSEPSQKDRFFHRGFGTSNSKTYIHHSVSKQEPTQFDTESFESNRGGGRTKTTTNNTNNMEATTTLGESTTKKPRFATILAARGNDGRPSGTFDDLLVPPRTVV